jgi:hypothetical protein
MLGFGRLSSGEASSFSSPVEESSFASSGAAVFGTFPSSRASLAALCALGTILILDAPGLASWAEALPPSSGTDALTFSLAAWRDFLASFGLDVPWRAVHAWSADFFGGSAYGR